MVEKMYCSQLFEMGHLEVDLQGSHMSKKSGKIEIDIHTYVNNIFFNFFTLICLKIEQIINSRDFT